MKAAQWECVGCLPSDFLKDRICAYSGYHEEAGRSVHRLEVMRDRVIIVLGFADALRIKPLGSQLAANRYRAFVVGLGQSPLLASHAGTQRCLEIELFPWSARELFGGDVTALTQTVVELADVWGYQARSLLEQLSEQSDWAGCLAVVDQFLIKRFLASNRGDRPEIMWAWRQLERTGGNCSIHALADTLSWSHRHFIACFREHVGITPKAAARRIRFACAHRLLTQASGCDSLSELSAICGYSDQSHFTREFRHFSGCTPKLYQGAHFPDLLGTPAAIVES